MINKNKQQGAPRVQGSQNKLTQNRSQKKNKKPKNNNNNNNNRNISSVYSPTSLSNNFVNKQASMKSTTKSDGSVVVRHREFISDIRIEQSSDFTLYQTLPVNPGIDNSFPWLYKIAQNYESYTFRKLVYEFETTSSTSSQASIMMALDYDPNDPAPPSKMKMMQYHNSTRTQVWNNMCCSADQKDLKKFAKEKYVRNGQPLGVRETLQNYDVANFYLAYSSSANIGLAGELYVSYEVELQTPQSSEISDKPIDLTRKFRSELTGVGDVNALPTAPFTKSVQPSLNEDEGNLPVTVTNSAIQFPLVGQYLLVIQIEFNGTIDQDSPTISGITPGLVYDFQPFTQTSNGLSIATTLMSVRTNDRDQQLTFNYSPLPTSGATRVTGHLIVCTVADYDVISDA